MVIVMVMVMVTVMLMVFVDRSWRSLNFHAATLQGDEAGVFALPPVIVFVFVFIFVSVFVFVFVFTFVFSFIVRTIGLVRLHLHL